MPDGKPLPAGEQRPLSPVLSSGLLARLRRLARHRARPASRRKGSPPRCRGRMPRPAVPRCGEWRQRLSTTGSDAIICKHMRVALGGARDFLSAGPHVMQPQRRAQASWPGSSTTRTGGIPAARACSASSPPARTSEAPLPGPACRCLTLSLLLPEPGSQPPPQHVRHVLLQGEVSLAARHSGNSRRMKHRGAPMRWRQPPLPQRLEPVELSARRAGTG